MPLKVSTPTRIFRYNGTDYPDPAPGQSAERSVELLAMTHAALTNAVPEPGKVEGKNLVINLKACVGTKG